MSRSDRFPRCVAVLLFVVLLAVACGDDASKSGTEVSRGTDAAASAIVHAATLQLSDFPPGWVAEPYDNSVDIATSCVPKLTKVADADSQNFSNSEAGASNSVAVFVTADEVNQQFVRLREQKFVDCLGKEIGDKIAKASSGENVKVDFAKVSTPTWGEETVAFQAKVTMAVGALTPSVYLDLIFVKVGRVVNSFSFVDALSPFDATLRDSLIAASARRMQTS